MPEQKYTLFAGTVFPLYNGVCRSYILEEKTKQEIAKWMREEAYLYFAKDEEFFKDNMDTVLIELFATGGYTFKGKVISKFLFGIYVELV